MIELQKLGEMPSDRRAPPQNMQRELHKREILTEMLGEALQQQQRQWKRMEKQQMEQRHEQHRPRA